MILILFWHSSLSIWYCLLLFFLRVEQGCIALPHQRLETSCRYPEPNFTPSYSNGSPFSIQEILSSCSQSQPLWQRSGITRRCWDLASCWCSPGAIDLWKHAPGIQGLIHTHGICTSALVARWTYWLLLAIPKLFVHHSLQEQLHICHSELHLHLPAMSPRSGFNPTLKPQELKYKSVLILEEYCLLLETWFGLVGSWLRSCMDVLTLLTSGF